MRQILATTCIISGVLLAGGCATKKYVRNTTAPVQAKVDQVGEQATKNGQVIEETKGELKNDVKQVDERAQSGISAAKEQAMTAQNKANDAMSRADQANQAASKNNEEINHLRTNLQNVVANLDDYKVQNQVTIPFKFDKYALTPEARQQLDSVAQAAQGDKRYFIAVEGFTDSVGSHQYNEALSRRRADAVVQYLVAKHDIPIYRIHMVGLGSEKPAEEGRGRAARAKNRRVEVKLFTAELNASAMSAMPNQSGSTAQRTQP